MISRLLSTVFVVLIIFCTLTESLRADNAAPSGYAFARRLLYHGIVTEKNSTVSSGFSDGHHTFHIKLYAEDGSLVHEESIESDVLAGSYDLLLGSNAPLTVNPKRKYVIGIALDDGEEVRSEANLSTFTSLNESILPQTLNQAENRVYLPIDQNTISAQMAEKAAFQSGILMPIAPRMQPHMAPYFSPLHGLNMEMSIASPEMPTNDPYQMAK